MDGGGPVFPIGPWLDWVPTWTNITIGNAVVVAKYKRLGNVVHYRLEVTFGNTTTVDGAGVDFSLPVAAVAVLADTPRGMGWCFDAGTARYLAIMSANSTTVNTIHVLITTGAHSYSGDIGAAVPFVWANGDIIQVHGTYEAA